MSKLKLIENQLIEAKKQLQGLDNEENQLAYDYVEYALILTKELLSD